MTNEVPIDNVFEHLTFRPLYLQDIDQRLIDILSELSDTTGLTVEAARETYKKQIASGIHHSFVAVMDWTIIGVGSILIDYKLAHSTSAIHLEDFAITRDWQLKGIGRRFIEHLESEAAKYNPYKIILDCAEEKVCFYEKCGFSRSCVCLRKSIPTKEEKSANISI